MTIERPKNEFQFISILEAAGMAGVSPATAHRYAKPGGIWEGIAFKIGGRVKVSRDGLNAWFEDAKRGPKTN